MDSTLKPPRADNILLVADVTARTDEPKPCMPSMVEDIYLPRGTRRVYQGGSIRGVYQGGVYALEMVVEIDSP